ncbi:alpha/beta hydrolase [Aeromicrobium ginsengisoli]|uniref:Alpha/beta hydrolase n=1 Tax=Aeromicrobium ginsengisoli TaxID=363867 RepID=A0A5M4FJ50_9ACTN|nr:alpha/beta hydrolase [Aeromicrobium ginsengisoli]KAA1399988.1 alpha/beta hydrolase [Aeromicrobium ginsengisoli]
MLARISLGIAAMMAGVIIVAAYAQDRDDERSLIPVATGEKAPAGLARFYDQKLTWTDCEGSLCTWVRVPLDYDKPAGTTIRLRVKLRPAASGKADGKVFINPGGPGGSGVGFVDTFASLTSRDVLEKRDIIGFDPRGVGQSDPLKCESDTSFDKLVALDPDPDTLKLVDKLGDGFRKLGKACVKHSGALASHVSTEEAARDLDVLRALMGERKLDYYGASYGTQLGATYADLFPRHTGAMILDGAVDPSLSKERQGYDQAKSFQRELKAYVAACLEDGDCPLGEDQKAASDNILELLAALEEKPIQTRFDRKLTEGAAIYGIAYAMYDPDSWSVLTTGLVRAGFGDGSILLTLSDQYYGRRQDGTYRDNSAQAFFGIRCLDFPKAPSDGDIARLLPDYQDASPVFGGVMAWSAAECQDWPARSKHPQRPVHAEGAAPIVVIGSTRDPATPYAWSETLARDLSSGILVTRKGDGHTGYGVGNACVDGVVNRYLLFREQPTGAVTCDDTE